MANSACAGRKVKLVLLACTTLATSFVAWHIAITSVAQRGFLLYGPSPNKELRKLGVSYNTQSLSMDFPWLSYSLMPRVLSRKEYNDYLDLIETFASLMEAANVTYAMYFGTLLGSYRMHNMLPWDDDVDLIIKFDDMRKAIEAIQKYSKLGTHLGLSDYLMVQRRYNWSYQHRDFQEFNLNDLTPANMFHCFKFFSTGGAVQRKWRWPFLDVFAFKENSTDIVIRYERRAVDIKRDRFYPLVRRPFGHLWLPSPKDSNGSLHAFEVLLPSIV